MRYVMAGLLGLCLAGSAGAQGLGDVGRSLGGELLQRVLPQQQPQIDPRQEEYLRREREREVYEQGRRDAEAERRLRREERRREEGRPPEDYRGQPTARGGRDYDEDRRRDDPRRPYYEPDPRRGEYGRDAYDERRPRREGER